MFGVFDDAVKSAVNVVGDTWDAMLGDGEGPTRSDVAKLISSGMEIAAVAAALGVGEDVVQSLLEEPRHD
jgi:hypothetical protein